MPTPQQGKIIVNGIEYGGTNQIDDTTTSGGTTWSSTKISNQIANDIYDILPTESASGAVASFETPLTLPLVSHNVTIEPVQAGTGDPSPSNVRPISGWSAVTISHSGADTSEAEEVEIALGQTVYGSELDVTNGVLRVTHELITLDGSESWSVISSGTNKRFTLALSDYTPNNAEISDIFKYSPTNTGDFGTFYFAQGVLRIPDGNDTFATLADFKQWLSEKTPSFLFQLTTPVEVTLTPEQINTLKGVNNIWADTGDTAVEYKQDIQTYIDSRLASGTRSLSLAKAPVETKEETKQEEQEGDEDVNR